MTRRSSSRVIARRQTRAVSGLLSLFAHGLRAQVSAEQQAEAHYWRIRQFASKEETERMRQADLANKLVLQDLEIEKRKRALGLSASDFQPEQGGEEPILLLPGQQIASVAGYVSRVVTSDPAQTILECHGRLYQYLTSYVMEQIRAGRAVVIR